jgi:predicted P-loop ATPase
MAQTANIQTIEVKKDSKTYDKVPKIQQLEDFINERYDLRINVITNQLESKPKGSNDPYTIFNDSDLRVQLYKKNIGRFDGELKALLGSDYVERYDPFLEYFEGLPKWGGQVDYITELANYCQTDNQEWFLAMFKKHLVRIAGQATNQIPFNKQCLTLVSNQNDGKTSFLDFLVPDSLKDYCRKGFDFHSGKEGKISLVQNILINLDELAQFTKTDLNNEFKAVLSETSVKFRPLYQPNEQTVQRRASFVASTNNCDFLTDETGNVRWLPFVVKEINHDNGGANGYNKNIIIDLVWAQAYTLLKDGYHYDLRKQEIEIQEKHNKQFIKVSFQMELIQRYFVPSDKDNPQAEFMQSSQIAEFIKKLTTININANILGKDIKRLGFENVTKRVKETEKSMPIKGYWVLKI